MTGDARRPIIEIRGLSKRFGSAVTAVDEVSLDIREGELFALLGPSGCGKTTLLRMLAGLETPDRGRILIDGRDMAAVPPNRRPVNMVFQSYAVFPHMSVADNVGYGLKVTGTSRAEIGPRVAAVLDLVRLGGLGARRPDQLSGGERQRVALARALIKRPRVLLLDEPLSALDAKLRVAMRLELVRLQHSVGITFVIVTHDQEEALSMADRIAVMDRGKVRQVAAPADLYERPNSRFVADFIGRMNLFEGRVAGADGTFLLLDVAGIGRIRVPAAGPVRGDIGVAVRPERIRLTAEPPPAGVPAVAATVSEVAYHGGESHVFLAAETGTEIAATLRSESRHGAAEVAGGARLWVSWAPEDTLVLDQD